MKGIVPFWEHYSKQPYQAQQPKSWSSPKPKGACTCIVNMGTWVHFHTLICSRDEKLKGQFWNPHWNIMADLSCWSFLDQFLLALTYTKRFTDLNWLSPKDMVTGCVCSGHAITSLCHCSRDWRVWPQLSRRPMPWPAQCWTSVRTSLHSDCTTSEWNPNICAQE